MIYRNNNYYDKLKKLNRSNFEFLFDFDRTITSSDSTSSWGVASRSGILGDGYIEENKGVYYYYRGIEVNHNINEKDKNQYMIEWMNKQIELLAKYGFDLDKVNKLLEDNPLIIRDNYRDLALYLDSVGIPVNIVSAGVFIFINGLLDRERCLFSNTSIYSNKFEFSNDGKLLGIIGTPIQSFNKELVVKDILTKEYLVIVGDQLEDLNMGKYRDDDHKIKVCFISKDNMNSLELYKENFDLILSDDLGFDILLNDLKSVRI